MIYKDTWLLTGTEQQKTIVREALDKIFFPWERLNLPRKPTEIGWRDLNNGTYNQAGQDQYGEKFESVAGKLDKPAEVRHHGGVDHVRNYIMGIVYTASGRIYIDNWLVNRPELAAATVSAEIAHCVDYFLPLTDEQRQAIILEVHDGVADGHTWWEKSDYGTEYYDLVGETFMMLFTDAYSDIPFGDRSNFTHRAEGLGPFIRQVIGIERTDAPALYKLPTGSTVYHKATHRTKRMEPLKKVESWYRPCRVCKPK